VARGDAFAFSLHPPHPNGFPTQCATVVLVVARADEATRIHNRTIGLLLRPCRGFSTDFGLKNYRSLKAALIMVSAVSRPCRALTFCA